MTRGQRVQSRVTVRNNLSYRVIARLQEKYIIDVGVIGKEAAKTHKGEPLTIAQIAEIHEYGLGVPQRSWLRGFLDENDKQIRAVRSKLWRQLVELKIDSETAASRLGAWLVGGIKKRIAARIPPPNAESTIARKGSSTPLIDTGQLRSAINYRIEVTKDKHVKQGIIR